MDEESASEMIGEKEAAVLLGTGAILILLGLVPGLFAQIVTGVRNAIAALSGEVPVEAEIAQPGWLGVFGVLMILGVLLAFSA